MKRVLAKKTISLFLGILLLFGMMPLFVWLPGGSAMALEAVTTYDDVRARLELILEQTNGMYWNAVCGKSGGVVNKKSEKALKAAAETGDYASVCTKTRCTGKPRHDENGCQSNLIEGCRQCQGFGKWLGYCHTGFCPSGNKSTNGWNRVTSVEKGFELKPGDFIHKLSNSRYGHYIMIVGTSHEDPDRVIYMDCNSDGGCKIAVHEERMETVVRWINQKGGCLSRYEGFSETKHNLDAYGDCHDDGCFYHAHVYDEKGVCKNDDCLEDYLLTGAFAAGEENWRKGTASAPENGCIVLRERPYASSDEMIRLKGDETVPITGICSSHYGVTWYEVSYEGRKAYVYSGGVQASWESGFLVEGVSYPEWGTEAGASAKTAVEGEIYSGVPIASVKAEVLEYNYQTPGKIEISVEETEINGTHFSLDNAKFDSLLAFRILTGENTWRYRITVTDETGYMQVYAYDFYLTKHGKNYCTVTFDGTDGSGAPEKITVPYGDSVLLNKLPVPEKEGMVFSGWAEDAVHPGRTYLDSYRPWRDTVLYAIWEEPAAAEPIPAEKAA